MCTVGQPEGPLVLLSQSPLDTQHHRLLRRPHLLLCCQSRMGELLWLRSVMHLPQRLQTSDLPEQPLRQKGIGTQHL